MNKHEQTNMGLKQKGHRNPDSHRAAIQKKNKIDPLTVANQEHPNKPEQFHTKTTKWWRWGSPIWQQPRK